MPTKGEPFSPRPAPRTCTWSRRCSRVPGARWSWRSDRALGRAGRRLPQLEDPRRGRRPGPRNRVVRSRARSQGLDVATGGGHVARRLREHGCEVVTTDSSPGMKPDVVSRAEDLPFADGSFDCVVSRIAPHHFTDVRHAVEEMARVSNDVVVIEDTLFSSERHEQAEKLRDPTHIRDY